MTSMPGRFWNETIETLSPGERRRLENERLVEQIAYDAATSPFFRARLDAGGVGPGDIRDVADLAAIPFMEKADIAESQLRRGAARHQPVRPARIDRADPGDRRHDRPTDAHRDDAPGHRRLWRGGRPGPVDDGLSAGRDRVRVHELQPLRRWPVRPPDVRDPRRGDGPVRCRSQRAPADDDGRAGGSGRHLGHPVVRRAAGRGRRRTRHRAARRRPAQGLLLR